MRVCLRTACPNASVSFNTVVAAWCRQINSMYWMLRNVPSLLMNLNPFCRKYLKVITWSCNILIRMAFLLVSFHSILKNRKVSFPPLVHTGWNARNFTLKTDITFFLLHIKLYKRFHIKDILLSHFQHLLTFLQLGCTKRQQS